MKVDNFDTLKKSRAEKLFYWNPEIMLWIWMKLNILYWYCKDFTNKTLVLRMNSKKRMHKNYSELNKILYFYHENKREKLNSPNNSFTNKIQFIFWNRLLNQKTKTHLYLKIYNYQIKHYFRIFHWKKFHFLRNDTN